MNKILLFILLSSLFAYAFSCQNDEETPQIVKNLPEVETISVEVISGSSVEFRGNVVTLGDSKVLEYGFLISNSKEEHKLPVDLPFKIGNFALEANVSQEFFIVQAYIEHETGRVTGEQKFFFMPESDIENINPTSGRIGDVFSLTGKNFPTDKDLIQVKFQETNAKIIDLTSEKIVVEVPENGYEPFYLNGKVEVNIFLKSRLATTFDFYLLPTIYEFEPKSGAYGTHIKISGKTLNYSHIKIFCNDLETVNASPDDDSTFYFHLPSGLTSEKVKIKVVAAEIGQEFQEEFTILPPVIQDFNPKTGIAGTILTITGTHFDYIGNESILIGDIVANLQENSSNQIKVIVPLELKPGNYKLRINTDLHSVISSHEFELASPRITSFSPESGYPGTTVTIYGSNLYSEVLGGWANFGTNLSSVNFNSSNSITAMVPFKEPSGKTKIRVEVGGQIADFEKDFTILEPTITSIYPTSGSPGSLITITGTGFYPDEVISYVFFGDERTHVQSASSTSLDFIVPSWAGTGEMEIHVQIGDRNIYTDQKFTILR